MMLLVIRRSAACAAALLYAATGCAEPVSQRFDLFCTGSTQTDQDAKPFASEFRVDLATRKWCDDRCDNVRSFAKIERNELTFSESEDSETEELTYVDRLTGGYYQRFRSALVNSTTKAHCERRPYKPITYKRRAF